MEEYVNNMQTINDQGGESGKMEKKSSLSSQGKYNLPVACQEEN